MLIIDDPVLACAYLREFRRVYENAINEYSTATITSDDSQRPPPVTELDFAVSPSSSNVVIDLTWQQPSYPEFGRYYIYVETYNFSTSVYNILPDYAGISDITTTSYSFQGIGNTTYYCMVNYVSNYGVESEKSSLLTISPTPPQKITTLTGFAAGNGKGDINLSWIAPREFDSVPTSGNCKRYFVKHATFPFEKYSDDGAYEVDVSTIVPKNPGEQENFVLNFPAGNRYIAVFGENSNNIISEISNLLDVYVVDTSSPSAVTDISVQRNGSDGFYLTWTMPGDNGTEGSVTSCFVYYSSAPNFDTVEIATVTSPSSGGDSQSYFLTNLDEFVRYRIKVRPVDEAGNYSESPFVYAYTGIDFTNTPSFMDSVNVSTSPTLEVCFKIEIDTTSAASCVEIWDTRDNAGNQLSSKDLQFTVSVSSKSIKIYPTLSPNHKYELKISIDLKDIDGFLMLASQEVQEVFTFVTVCSPDKENVFFDALGSSITIPSGNFSQAGYVEFGTSTVQIAQKTGYGDKTIKQQVKKKNRIRRQRPSLKFFIFLSSTFPSFRPRPRNTILETHFQNSSPIPS